MKKIKKLKSIELILIFFLILCRQKNMFQRSVLPSYGLRNALIPEARGTQPSASGTVKAMISKAVFTPNKTKMFHKMSNFTAQIFEFSPRKK